MRLVILIGELDRQEPEALAYLIEENRAPRRARSCGYRIVNSRAESRIAQHCAAPSLSCAKTRPMGLRGCALAELEHAAEPLTAPDGASSDWRGLGRDELIAQTLVRPFLMIMVDIRSDGGPEVPFAQGHQSRQTLGSDRPNKSFGKRIRTPGGQAHEFYITLPQQVPEAAV